MNVVCQIPTYGTTCPTEKLSALFNASSDANTLRWSNSWNHVWQGESDTLPPAYCIGDCDQLQAGAILFAIVFGVTAILLTISLLGPRLKRRPMNSNTDASRAGTMSHNIASSDEVSYDPDQTDPVNIRSSAVSVEVDPSLSPPAFATVSPPVPSHDAPVSAQLGFICSQLSMMCRTCGFVCVQLCSTLKILLWHGSKHVLPWWQHLLTLVGSIGLIVLSIIAFINMLQLTTEHCSEYAPSCMMSGIVTWTLTGIVLRNLFLNKSRLMQSNENVLEVVGLLAEDSEVELDREDGSNHDQIRSRNINREQQVDESL